jgi:hypothetical protein
MLAKVPKIPPNDPKAHTQMLVKVPKMTPNYPKYIGMFLLHAVVVDITAQWPDNKVGLYKVNPVLTHPWLERAWFRNPCTSMK